MPGVAVGTEVQDVARVERVEEVRLDQTDRAVHLLLADRAGGVHLDVRRAERLGTGHRVVAAPGRGEQR